MARQAEMITRLQQQQPQPTAASAFHTPPMGNSAAGATAHTANVQGTQGNPAEPIPEQASKVPIYQTEAPFEFEGVNSIPDLEDEYTESVVTLLERFKMPHIDLFDGFGDLMVHLRLFSDILRPMGLTLA
ncbi:hypothetical protein ACSBR1_006193 [Camellia fascicularis]